MDIINKSARLIDFSFNKKKYRLMPAGEAVEVPNEATKSAFLKALIADGSIAVVVEESTNKEQAAIELGALREKATGLGIEVDEEWNAKKLATEIKLVELLKEATGLGIEVKGNWGAKKLATEIEKKKGQ